MFVRQAGGGYIQKRLQSAHLVKPHWLIPGTPPGAALRVIRCHLAIATTTLQVRYEEEPPSPRYGRFGKLLPGLKEATKTCSPRPLRSVSATTARFGSSPSGLRSYPMTQGIRSCASCSNSL